MIFWRVCKIDVWMGKNSCYTIPAGAVFTWKLWGVLELSPFLWSFRLFLSGLFHFLVFYYRSRTCIETVSKTTFFVAFLYWFFFHEPLFELPVQLLSIYMNALHTYIYIDINLISYLHLNLNFFFLKDLFIQVVLICVAL